MFPDDKVTENFCMVDDFCKFLQKEFCGVGFGS